jgi:hypothetical protein
MNVTFQALDLAAFFEATQEPKLQYWDIVIPQGTAESIILGGISVKQNRRKVRFDENSVLVSGHRARVASRGIEREGLPADLVAEITEAYRVQHPGKSIPNQCFRARRLRPLLLLHPIEIENDGNHNNIEDLVAVGMSIPRFDDSDSAKRVLYRVNLVEWRAMAEAEIDDDADASDNDPR